MKRIQADYSRYVELEGVGPVSRPVDIDQPLTGFTELRTLRIYRFETGSVIDGHAEEDEVFIVVLAGSIELTMTWGAAAGLPQALTAGESHVTPCAAYLPPHAAYRLVPQSQADIAYARARPRGARPPKVFTPNSTAAAGNRTVILEENAYAEKLRIRLTRLDRSDGACRLVTEEDANAEALLHIRDLPAGTSATCTSPGSTVLVESWDTIAVSPGERPTLQLNDASALVLTVLAG
jgi:hypothetical protein